MATAAHVPSTSYRFWARAIDGVVVAIFLAPAFGVSALNPWAVEDARWPWALVLYFVVASVAYETLAVWIFGTTAGKWVFGLRVVPAGHVDRSPGGPESLLRTVAGKLSFFVWYAVYATMFFRADRTHLADWIAGTRVVSALPRRHPARRRALFGLILVALFGWIGWASALWFAGSLSWDAAGVTIQAGSALFRAQ